MKKIYLISPIIFAISLWDFLVLVVFTFGAYKAVEGLKIKGFGLYLLYFSIAAVALIIGLYLLKFLTYRIVVQEENLIEKGLCSKHRTIKLADIRAIYTSILPGPLHFLIFSPRSFSTPEVSGFSFSNDKSNPFPAQPMNQKLLKDTHERIQTIEIDQKVEEFAKIYNNFAKIAYLSIQHFIIVPLLYFLFFSVMILTLSSLFK